MGRWEPNAPARLAQAALMLYARQGFERTTAAEIASRAGLTERTFFRHFADKREVLFFGADSLRDILVRAIADAPPDATALDAAMTAVQAMAAVFQENPGQTRLINAVASANAELRERQLAKLADLTVAMAAALRDRGIPERAASLAAETAIAVHKVAFARWLSEPGQPYLPEFVRDAFDGLRRVLADQPASVLSAS